MTSETVSYLLPELVLVITATGIYLAGAFLPGQRAWSVTGLGGLLVSAALLARSWHAVGTSGPLATDAMSFFVRALSIVVGVVFLILIYRATEREDGPELAGTLLMAVAGTMIVASAAEMVLLFVGLELISIPTYVLLYIGRRGVRSQEAATKYFFLSILSSALFLYGLSFIYGTAGTTLFTGIAESFARQSASPAGLPAVAYLGAILVLAGLGFKVAAAPFHFYAPDVYQGTTHVNAGLLAVLPKIAGFVAMLRLLVLAMPGLESLGWRAAIVLAILTMTLGNVLALWQGNVRRLLAYSSIAHAGYMLIGVAVALAGKEAAGAPNQFDGVGATLFYLALYSLATMGAFATLTFVSPPGEQLDRVDDLAGLGRRHPISALAMSIFMFSLAGVPPLAGFWGKLTLFAGALSVGPRDAGMTATQYWFLVLAIVGVLNAAIAAAYYLRIVAAMYFRPSEGQRGISGDGGAWTAMVLCAVLVLVVGLLPGRLSQDAGRKAEGERLKDAVSRPIGLQEPSKRRQSAYDLVEANFHGLRRLPPILVSRQSPLAVPGRCQ
ncbi:MAG: NADH-quinone oxidoreductase subunit N [Pirellulales bacterium]